MIPKIIHYCWFGGKPLPLLSVKCIESWRKYCPTYEIKEWNESNFDLNCCDYIKEAYEAKKWAFITDYVRLYVMVNEGGIYMDTDVEVIASLDKYLSHKAFSGFENQVNIPTGIMACEKGFPLFNEFLHDYDKRHFKLENGNFDLTTNVETITKLCKKYGFIGNNKFQEVNGFVLYPSEVFCPKNYDTGNIYLTKRTATIHHFSGSWLSKESKISAYIKGRTKGKGKLLEIIGKIIAGPFTFISRAKRDGFKNSVLYYLKNLLNRQKRE